MTWTNHIVCVGSENTTHPYEVICSQIHERDVSCRYEIQTGIHHPYEDCVAALRIYKKMRSLSHPNFSLPNHRKDFLDANSSNSFDFLTKRELMNLSPDALLEMSLPNYKCWCLDAKNPMNS